MRITKKVEITPSGFYCQNTSRTCQSLNKEKQLPYCTFQEVYLDYDSKGNVLKCKECLLEERYSRLKQ